MPEEWMALGKNENNEESLPILAKGLFKNSKDGSSWWRPVLINSYDNEREIFKGYWDETNITEYIELSRINLCFNAEDPRIFA
jgi:hypothetical protein